MPRGGSRVYDNQLSCQIACDPQARNRIGQVVKEAMEQNDVEWLKAERWHFI